MAFSFGLCFISGKMQFFSPTHHRDPTWPITTQHDPSRPITTHHDPKRPITTHHDPLWPIVTQHNPTRPIMTHHDPTRPKVERLEQVYVEIHSDFIGQAIWSNMISVWATKWSCLATKRQSEWVYWDGNERPYLSRSLLAFHAGNVSQQWQKTPLRANHWPQKTQKTSFSPTMSTCNVISRMSLVAFAQARVFCCFAGNTVLEL